MPEHSPDQGELLVVADEPFLRDAVAASLRFLGFDVATAETGSQALRLARDRSFDLIVLDVMLPDTDGFEIVRRLRGEGNNVPVIFLTQGHPGGQGHRPDNRRRRLRHQALRARGTGRPRSHRAAPGSARCRVAGLAGLRGHRA
jgi:CheY-like chemotaxis protein